MYWNAFRLIGIFVCLTLIFSSCQDEKSKEVNIIIVVLDEWDESKNISDFPNLNQLKSKGVYFENAFTTYPEEQLFYKSLFSGKHVGQLLKEKNEVANKLKSLFESKGYDFSKKESWTNESAVLSKSEPFIYPISLKGLDLANADKAIGQILEQMPENTLLALTAIKGTGVDFSEKNLRVPLVFYHPQKTEKAKLVSQPTYTADILPTIASFARIPFNDPSIDGLSFNHLLTQKDISTKDRFLFWKSKDEETKILRYNQWKFIKTEDTDWQLFDMLTDPEEIDNVIDYHPGKVGNFKGKVKKEL